LIGDTGSVGASSSTTCPDADIILESELKTIYNDTANQLSDLMAKASTNGSNNKVIQIKPQSDKVTVLNQI
jgi:hypothetical protein